MLPRNLSFNSSNAHNIRKPCPYVKLHNRFEAHRHASTQTKENSQTVVLKEAAKLRAEGKDQDALKMYTDAILNSEIKPSAKLHHARGVTALALNDIWTATYDAVMSVELEPKWWQAQALMGSVLLELEVFSFAKQTFEIANRLKSDQKVVLEGIQAAKEAKKTFKSFHYGKIPEFKHSNEQQYFDKVTGAWPVKIAHTEYGRGLIATQSFFPGQQIFVSEPFLIATNLDKIYCHHCAMEIYKPTICKHCNETRYCSSECESKAWDTYHQALCKTNYSELVELCKDIGSRNGADLLLAAKIAAMGKQQLPNNSPLELQEIRNTTAPKMLKRVSFPVVNMMIQYQQIIRHCHLKDYRLFDVKAYATLSTLIAANSFYVGTHGVGLYKLATFINHSCVPNADYGPAEDGLHVICEKPIQAGEEITIAYVKDEDSEKRARHLMQYGFECKCPACVQQ